MACSKFMHLIYPRVGEWMNSYIMKNNTKEAFLPLLKERAQKKDRLELTAEFLTHVARKQKLSTTP
jgi:hypothetical protein